MWRPVGTRAGFRSLSLAAGAASHVQRTRPHVACVVALASSRSWAAVATAAPRVAGEPTRLRARAAAAGASLTGAGATFPNPIYSKWFDAYYRETGVRINYQSIGSGGGIRQFTEGTVDFGATDGPMTDEQIAAVQGNVLHVPTVLGAVVVTYNLPALGAKPLRFDGPTLADIFLGRITRWNDRRLAALNPGVEAARRGHPRRAPLGRLGHDLHLHRLPVARSRPTGRRKVGQATSVNWPVGLGGKGNEGVTQQVKQSEGAIGYVELIYAHVQRPAGGRDQERGRRSSSPADAQDGERGRRGRDLRAGHRLPGLHHQRGRARRRIRSPRSPGC